MGSNANKNMYKMIKTAFTVMVVLIVVYVTMRVSMTAYDFGYRVFTETAVDAAPGKNVEVTIDSSMGAMDVADLLCEKGLVRDANLFWLQYKLSAYADEITPGTYTLNTSMEPKEMMALMAVEPEETETEESESVESTETTQATESSETTESGSETTAE